MPDNKVTRAVRALKSSRMALVGSNIIDLMDLIETSTWASHPLWLAYGTKLDSSDLVYYCPEMFDTLTALTGEDVPYVKAHNGKITLLIVGAYAGEIPLGPFWTDDVKIPKTMGKTRSVRLLRFGQAVQRDLEHRRAQWESSLRDGKFYLTTHRDCARAVGRVLGIDMENHDLTKTRIVQVALGFMWHWQGGRATGDEDLMAMARDAISAGHLEVEDHHPEFAGGSMDPLKMFADRLSVHLQKDPQDVGNGWLLKECFIPEAYRDQWRDFSDANRHLDLYALAWDRF